MKTTESKTNAEPAHAVNSASAKQVKNHFFMDQTKAKKSFFGPQTIQAKLKIGQPNDKYEQEADRVADAVMRMPDSAIQRKCEECEKEEKLQKKTNSDTSTTSIAYASPDISNRLQSNVGTGSRLSDTVQSEMGHKMGADFSGVNIHTGSEAAEMNREIGAKAFTHRSNIYFNKGQFNPASSEGKHLLAHELTHVVQQGGPTKKSRPSIEQEPISQANKDYLQRQEVFNFSDDEGSQIEVPVMHIAGTGDRAGEAEVEAKIVELRGWVNLYVGAYRDGLNDFSDAMSFSSNEEAKPRYFDVALKEVGKILLDELIDYATAEMPIVGPVVKGAKTVMMALYDEAQRAQRSQGEAQIRSYINSTRNALTERGGIEEQLLRIMDSARPALLSRYRAAVSSGASSAPDEASRRGMIGSQGINGILTGEAAIFIRDLTNQVEQFKNRVPRAPHFQRQFTEAFADTPGLTDYVSHGGEESGSLHLNMEIYRERSAPGDEEWSYRIEHTDSSWRLATSAPRASRLAQSLMDSIEGSIENTSLPKYLHVRVETEVPWLNDYGNAVIYFRNIANPDFRGWDTNLSRWVWSLHDIRRHAFAVHQISSG